jgi:hypothetical protein
MGGTDLVQGAMLHMSSGRADSERERSRAQLARVGGRREGEGAAGAEARTGRWTAAPIPFPLQLLVLRPGPARVWKHGASWSRIRGGSAMGRCCLGRRAGREATTAPRRLLDAQSAGLLLGFGRIAELGAGKRCRGGRREGAIAQGERWRGCGCAEGERRREGRSKWGSKAKRMRRAVSRPGLDL